MGMTPMGPSGGDDDPGNWRPVSEINVTPFVDVMLVLLIVFMVAAPLMMVGVPVELPKSSAARLDTPRQPVIVSVARDGAVWLRDEPLTDETLVPRLVAVLEAEGEGVVYVRGDRGIEYGRVMQVLGQVGAAGFARVSLIAEAMPAGGTAPAGAQ